MKGILFLLVLAVFCSGAIDSLTVSSAFGFISKRDNNYDLNAGVDMHFNKRLYTNHYFIYDRYKMLNQISSIGFYYPHFNLGYLMVVKYKSDYFKAGIKIASGIDLFFGKKDATNLIFKAAFLMQSPENMQSIEIDYYFYGLYNLTAELGTRAIRVVLLSGDMPTLNFFGYAIQKGDLYLDAYNILVGIRSNIIKETKLGIFAYSPYYNYDYHNLKIQTSDKYGGLLEMQRILPNGFTGLVYLGFIPKDKPYFSNSFIFKIGMTKRLF